MILLSHFQAKKIIDAYNKRIKEIEISLDLGRSLSKIKIDSNYVIFPDEQKIDIKEIEKICKDERSVYLIKDNRISKVQFFSEKTGKFYKLVVVSENSPPTLEISGIHMHRIKDIDPLKDTLLKLRLIKPLKNKVVLDVCTGLGYTAIWAKNLGAKKVITVEKDENVLEIAKYNPWSKELFENKDIEIYIDDALNFVKKLEDESFDRIIHDPPRLTSETSHLYSEEIYEEFFRILRKGGKIVHYVGKPKYKRGYNLKSKVINKLKKVGFEKVRFDEKSLCVYAIKI